MLFVVYTTTTMQLSVSQLMELNCHWIFSLQYLYCKFKLISILKKNRNARNRRFCRFNSKCLLQRLEMQTSVDPGAACNLLAKASASSQIVFWLTLRWIFLQDFSNKLTITFIVILRIFQTKPKAGFALYVTKWKECKTEQARCTVKHDILFPIAWFCVKWRVLKLQVAASKISFTRNCDFDS